LINIYLFQEDRVNNTGAVNLLSVFAKTPFAKELSALFRAKNVTVEIDSSDGSLPALSIATVLNKKNVCLVVAVDEESAHQIITDLGELIPEREILFFPGSEILDGVVLPLSKRASSYQMKALHALVERSFGETKGNSSEHELLNPLLLVTTPEGLVTNLPLPVILNKKIYNLSNGDLVERDEIALRLVDSGYTSCSSVVSPGQFSVRGGVIDIFSPHERFPVRLELWGDEVDSMRTFDPYTQRSVAELEFATFMPETLLPQTDQPLSDVATLSDYLDSNSSFFWNLSPLERKNAANKVAKAFGAGCLDSVIKKAQERLKVVFLQGCQIKNESFQTVRAQSTSVVRFGADLISFVQWLRRQREGQNFVALAMSSDGEVERLSELLSSYSINFSSNQKRSDSRLPGLYRVSLNAGFEIEGFSLLGTSDLWDERTIVDGEAFSLPEEQRASFTDFTELEEGCLVVHIENGVGRFTKLNSLLIEGVRQEFLEIEYAKGDKLFVPVNQLDRVQKFVGNEGGRGPKLNRLGGTVWAQAKGKVSQSVERLARQLLELYAKREAVEGVAYPADTVWQREMEDAFPFTETRDQLSALKDLKRLLEKPSPMDLLLCGDVGYGKTELAIRAAFKVAQEGRQVAVLVPTTILAHQHYLTFSGRLAPFPVTMAVMSRLKGTGGNKEVAKRIKEGTVDVVIGTHRLLSKDIKFKDLGLLVIDEEQRFGVKAKEKIKELKNSVDVLSLSATPIPRTLNLALSGARDISVINTPPTGRLAVRTIVEEYDDNLVTGAIRRELNRGGQVYYVNNRIQKQDRALNHLKKLLPDAKIRVGHGQMKASDLETLMMDFYNRKFDVLISTTIIESGLDIPNVNTIIIEDSQRLGLSQLYQLRGRVGRTTRQAYAFLLYPSKMVIPQIAFKRLKAIEDFSELGSGFKVAMRDLELRGAGSILGSAQHGFVQAVGFELYTRLLREAVDNLRCLKENRKPPRQLSTIELQSDMFISDDYITCPELKMLFYRKLAEVKDFGSLEEVVLEMKDRFGPYPENLEGLIRSVRIRIKSAELGIKSVRQAFNELIFTCFDDANISEDFAANLVTNYANRVSFIREPAPGFKIGLLSEKNKSLLDLVEGILWYTE
jgi:transcription-repair coupling factor (superfamily II helicase)